tara:strand:- start:1827 stop:3167 length:1341 start_codon:yes stop_codon:yes gene_type:complete
MGLFSKLRRGKGKVKFSDNFFYNPRREKLRAFFDKKIQADLARARKNPLGLGALLPSVQNKVPLAPVFAGMPMPQMVGQPSIFPQPIPRVPVEENISQISTPGFAMRDMQMNMMEPRMMMADGDVALSEEAATDSLDSFLNADPEQVEFGMESRLRNVTLEMMDALSRGDLDAVKKLEAEKIMLEKMLRDKKMPKYGPPPRRPEGMAFGDVPLSEDDIGNIEMLADMFVDQKGNVLGKPNSEYGSFLISKLTKKLGQEKFNKIIADKVNEVKAIKSQDYAEFLSSAPEAANLLKEFKVLQSVRGYEDGDEVNVDKLPKGLKAMYESGPKGREGVKNIAAKTDKFAEGDEVSMMMMEMDQPSEMPEEGMEDIDMLMDEVADVAPAAQMLDQYVNMVIEMVQAGASEAEIIQMLQEAGLDEADINAVFQAVIEALEGPSIDSELAALG